MLYTSHRILCPSVCDSCMSESLHHNNNGSGLFIEHDALERYMDHMSLEGRVRWPSPIFIMRAALCISYCLPGIGKNLEARWEPEYDRHDLLVHSPLSQG